MDANMAGITDPTQTAHAIASSYSPPFDPALIAASPDTIRLAEMWPSNPNMQQMLVAVIAFVQAETKGQKAILTVPTAVTLTGCGFQLGRRLIESAARSATGTIDINRVLNIPDTIRALLDVRQASLQTFEQSGWDAVSPFPRSVVDHWWQVVQQHDNQSASANSTSAAAASSFDSETEKVVCAATVIQWIKQILQIHLEEQLACNSPLLALGMIEDLQLEFNYEDVLSSVLADEKSKRKARVARAFRKLNCTIAPDLDGMFTATSSEAELPDPLLNDPAMNSMDPDVLHVATRIEYAAMMRILDGKSWYHNASLIRIVAEQFIRGERQSHASDVFLKKMHLQPTRIEGMFIPHFMSQYNFSMASLQRKDVTVRLHFLVTDAAGVTWPLVLKFNNHEGKLTFPQPTHHSECNVVDIHQRSDGQLAFDGCRADPFSEMFEPHMSSEQETILHQMRIAAELSEKFWKDAGERAHPQLGAFPSEVNNSPPSSGSTAPFLGSVHRALQGDYSLFGSNPQFGVDVKQAKALFRQLEFEQIATQLFPLLDFQRWGMSRYCDLHKITMRRSFQSFLIDAAMEANDMPLLPAVLVELISEYYTLESMPYIPPEEQEKLIAAASP